MKRPSILLLNLLILLGYSSLLTWWASTMGGGWGGQKPVFFQWILIVSHSWGLFVFAYRKSRNDPRRKEMIVAALTVALIGHGLCFYNGATNASWN